MPAGVPERAAIRAALESGKLQLVSDPTDPWFGTHANVGGRPEVRFTNTVVVRTRGLAVDVEQLWTAPVSNGEGGLVPPCDATVFPAADKRERDDGDDGDSAAAGHKNRRSPTPASRALQTHAAPAHVPVSKFELWQITLTDKTRGCLPGNRQPAARQFKKIVSLHVWTGDSLPNVRLSQEGSIHIVGCLHIGLVMEIMQFLRTLPGITFAGDTRFYVDTVLTNVRFSLGYAVDRWRLKTMINTGDRSDNKWTAVYDAQADHVAVSVSCHTDAPLDEQSPVPFFTLDNGWELGRVSDLRDVLRTGARLRRKDPRHTFRIFANGTVTFACVWPPELEETYARFATTMARLRSSVQFTKPADASVVN